MKFIYNPKTSLEKFGEKIYTLLVENSKQTYYVGGMVRDLLLGKKITDIDVTTALTPTMVGSILDRAGIQTNDKDKKFGVIHAESQGNRIEITTMRTEQYTGTRYPKVAFITDPTRDSQRRDFTINALYLSQKDTIIKDFHHGIKDLNARQIRLIGNPELRIQEDPLRIVRAVRFALTLDCTLTPQTRQALQKYLYLVKKISQQKINQEIKKVQTAALQTKLKKIIFDTKSLDIL
jgi:tRNA nucleotidyltransferase/poly(A) polymerase